MEIDEAAQDVRTDTPMVEVVEGKHWREEGEDEEERAVKKAHFNDDIGMLSVRKEIIYS